MNRLKTRTLLAGLAGAALLSACGGGGGGSSKKALSNLGYDTPDATYLVQVPAEHNEPTYKGKAKSWSISPALPAGLELDPATGAISGTPLVEAPRTDYLVTAAGGGDKAKTTLTLTVVLPPRFAYAAADDDTISIYTVDAWTGALRFHAYQEHDAPDAGAEQVLVHDNGRFVFVANRGEEDQGSTLTSYVADEDDGSLALVGHVPIAEGPHHMSVRPDGLFLYATCYATHQVFAYAIDPATGALTLIDTIGTNTGPVRLEVDALGRFLFVAHGPSADITIFSIDDVTGTLSLDVGGFNYYSFVPSDVDVDPLGTYVYFTFEVTNNLVAYEVDPLTGALGRLLEASTTGSPSAVGVHPHGGYAYVASAETNTVDLFGLHPITGQPALLETYAAGGAPCEIEMDESGRYMYVLNADSDDVSVFAIDPNTGELGALQTIRSRAAATSVSVLRGDRPALPEAAQLYVLNRESDDLTAFAADPETGLLTRLGANVLAGAAPNEIASDPYGRFAFVTNADDPSLRVYRIDENDGTLSEGPVPLTLGATPQGVAVDRSGAFAFLSLAETAELVAYAVDPGTGALVEVDRIATPASPRRVSADPTGQFVYVASHGVASHRISAYRFADGVFVGAPVEVAAPGTPGAPTFSSTGERAFVTLAGSKLILPYDVDSATGALTPLSGGASATDLRPSAIAMHPAGRFAYAAVPGETLDSGYVALLEIDAGTGALVELDQTAAGLSPRDLIVSPDGATLYVANEGGDDVSVFSIDAESGALTLLEQPAVGLSPTALVLTQRIR